MMQCCKLQQTIFFSFSLKEATLGKDGKQINILFLKQLIQRFFSMPKILLLLPTKKDLRIFVTENNAVISQFLVGI